MSAERIAALVAGWVRLYTRHVDAPASARRREEIDADLYDHIAHARADGVADGRIARAIAWRMLRGVPADLAWRGRRRKETRSMTTSILRVAVGVAAILSIPLLGMAFSESVVWSLADFVVAGALLALVGTGIELAVRRSGNRLLAAGLGALGVAAGVLGNADDAPGLVLLGIALVGSAVALTVRARRTG